MVSGSRYGDRASENFGKTMRGQNDGALSVVSMEPFEHSNRFALSSFCRVQFLEFCRKKVARRSPPWIAWFTVGTTVLLWVCKNARTKKPNQAGDGPDWVFV